MAASKDRRAAYRLGRRLRADAAKAAGVHDHGFPGVEEIVVAVSALLEGMGLTASEAARMLAVVGIEIESDDFVATVEHVLALRDMSTETGTSTTLN